MLAPGVTRRPAVAVMLVLATMLAVAGLPAAARAQHTKLSLESIGPDGGNAGQSADLVGAPSVGKRAFIRTAEPLVSADTDSSVDLYERTGSGMALASTGPAGGNGAFGANFATTVQSGQTLFFQTEEQLVAADTDNMLDVYRREAGTTTLVSIGPDGGNGPYGAQLSAASKDGAHAFITTRESLVAADTDASLDIYDRSGGTTTLVSTGPNGGNGDPGVELKHITEDGVRAVFQTTESLVAADTDTAQDVYERAGGNTTLVSTGPNGGNGNVPANFDATSKDGLHIFFGTDESLVAADTDTSQDVYERASGSTTIHSIGPSGGNGAQDANLGGISETGSRVFIQTPERLNTTTDRDGLIDVYESTGGAVTLMTPGGNNVNGASNSYFMGASADGTRVFVRTEERLIAADTDNYQDVYQVQAGVLTVLSKGPAGGSGPTHAYFAGASADGTHVFFETREPLVSADTDASNDVYESYGGTTSLLSSGVTGGNGAYEATFRGTSSDGQRVFFRTSEQLVSGDTDLTADVYSANVPGTVTVLLDSMPDHAQDFSFTAIGLELGGFNFGPLGFGPTTFQLDDDLDPALTNDQVFSQVTPGTGYSVSETVPAGWDLAGAGCDDGSPVGNIDVDPGEDVTCTFTDQKRGKVVVVVDAVPNDAQDFSFTAGGGLSPTSFQLDDDSDGTLSNTLTFNDVPTGSGYSVSQSSVPSGWDQASATCSDGSPIGNISVSPDETVTCTFTNNKRGQIVVVKDAQPNDAQDFSFSAGGGLSPASFSLDDDSDGTLSNTRTFTNVAVGSGYSIAETVPSGWSQASATCSDGSPASNISVSAGEIVTCTFVNNQRGQIVVVKDAQPNDAQDFSFSAGGGLSPNSFSLDDDSDGTLSNTRTYSDLTPKPNYSLSETVPSGWDQSSATCSDGSPVSSIDVGPGETVTCTFTNKKRGQIVIVKDAVPNNGQDFSFTAAGGLTPTSFQLDDDNNPTLVNTRTFTSVAAHNGYSVSETVPSGWTQTGATCDDGSPVSNIDVGPAETVTCTFVNQRNGSLTITKDAVPNDAQDFSFSVGGGLSPATFALDDDSNNTLSNSQNYASVPVGVYSASETVPAGWDQASATCNDGSPVSAIDIGPNESVTCTFTNNKRGRVVAVLDTQPNDPQDFSFTAGGGLAPGSFSLDDDSDPGLSNTQTFNDIVVGGGYSLAAGSVPSGWVVGSSTCDDGSPVSNINVAPGEIVTCTFTIQKRGQVVVVKDATPNDPQDFSFTAGGGLSPTSFSLDDDSDGTLPNTRTFANLAPGSGYSVAETVPSGWLQASATCDDGSPVSNINVAPAEIVTCTFTNSKRGRIVVTKDALPDDPQDFSFTAGGGLSPASFSLDDDTDPALSNTRTFADVAPGSGYSLSETVPSGWDQTGATCDDGSPVTNISVSAGETVNCTFSNRKRARIVVVKDATPNDAQDFSFTAGGGLSPTSFSLDDDSDGTLSNTRTFTDLTPGGGYSVSETVPTGWDQATATCDDGSPVSNITLSAGEIVTCTFANTKRGKIVVLKDSQPDDQQNFVFTAGGGLIPSTFQLDDDTDPTHSNTRTFQNVVPGGGYSMSEAVSSGWDQLSATCDDGSPVSNINVAAGETVTCTFTNRKHGRIVVVHDAVPDDAQDFSFTAGGGLSPTSFQLDDDLDPALSNTYSFDDVPVGSGYSLSETVPAGWDQASATCDDGSSVSNVDVAASETVTCTFTNNKRGQIVAVKDATPDDPQDFAFTAGGGLSPSSFSLDDDADGTLSNAHTFTGVPTGSGYSLSEAVPSGWDQTAATCDDGSPVSNIDVAPGETVTCTFANRKRGKIVAVKDAQPDDPQNFVFTAGGGLVPSTFQLDDDADPTHSNTRMFQNVAPGSGYSLSETVPTGWDQASATCDDGSPVSNIDVAAGETVTCTFTNNKRGRIVIVKNAAPDDPQDFSFTAGGGLSPASFDLDDDSDGTLSNTQTFDDLAPGSGYSVSETVPSGWDQASASCNDGSPISNIDVSEGETVTCTFTNEKRGKVVVVKDAQPNDAQDFSFTAGGGLSPASFDLDDDSNGALSNTHTFNGVLPGAGYSVAETVPSGWDQASATCDDGSPVSIVSVAPGETVTCTFTNHKRGQVSITKDTFPDDAQNFSFTAGGGLSPTSFQLDDDLDPALSNTRVFDDVPTGSGYAVSETVPTGWDQTSATCDDGSPVSNISVSAGEHVACTFTNTKRGTIVVVKDATPNDAQDFSFSASGGLSPASFSLDDDSDGTLSNTRSFANVAPGSGYSLSETVPSGWDQTSATCDDGSPVSDIDVAAGEIVTCTFANSKRGRIVAVKDATPDDPQNFVFTAGGGLVPSTFQLDDDTDPTHSNTRMFQNVAPGSGYSLSETVPTGWDQTSATCDDGSSVSDIDVSVGETVTCTFANRKRGTLVVVEDAVPNDAQDFSFTAGGGLSPASFDLDDDSDGTLSNTHTFDDVVPGSGYSVAQTTPGGWDLDSATCDDGSPLSNVNIAAGETVTCTFVHHQRGSVTAVKQAQPNDAQNFTFSAGGGLSPTSFQLDDDSDGTLPNSRTFNDVTATSGYSLSETVPSGWDQTAATCDDGSPVSNIAVAPGEHVTCTFTNRKRGTIVVVQDSQPNDPQDFSFTAGGGLSPTSFSLDDDSDGTLSNTRTFANVPATAGYSIAQSLPAGWQLASATCDDGSPLSNIDVGPAETVTCTFHNNKRGKIVAVKAATPEDPQDFSFTAGGGLSPASFQLDDDSDGTLSNTRTFDDVAPGSGYSLSETVPSGWEQTGATCDDGSPVSNINVAAGETVTCTFSNRKRGKIVVVKDATPNDAQDFSFTAGGGLSPTSFQLDDDSDGTLSNTHTFTDVTPASGYSVAETLPTGWTQVSAICSDGSPTSNIDVSAAETVTCTFVNTRGYVRPRGASPFRVPVVPAYGECTAPNRTHGPALEFPSCNPPAQLSDFLTVGTPDANSRTANMIGSVRFEVINGDPSTPGDQADMTISASVTDVRVKTSLNDYTGELEARIPLRVTDRLNGTAQNEPGTVIDVPFTFPVPCTATGGTGNVGATCSLSTTADALMPGLIVETKRTIWQMSDLLLRDGGPDGVASTQDNTLFARQGIFVP
jgi:agmatine/peptidylarginine deiminase